MSGWWRWIGKRTVEKEMELALFDERNEDDDQEMNVVDVLSSDIDVEIITRQMVAFVQKDSSSCALILDSEDESNLMARLVRMNSSSGGTFELLGELVTSSKANVIGQIQRNRTENMFVQKHIEAWLKDQPGMLLSMGVRSDLIK